MKKIISLLGIISVLLTACGRADYYYVDNLPSIEIQAYEHDPNFEGVEVEELNDILDFCKETMGILIPKETFSYFNWDRLEAVEIRYSPKTIALISNADAWYNDSNNVVYVNNKGMSYSSDELAPIIIHELIHCLTFTEHTYEMGMLYEGIADFFTMQIASAVELPYEICYYNEICAILWLFDIYGSEDTIKMFYDGTLNARIDKDLGRENMGEKLNIAMCAVHACQNDDSAYIDEEKDALYAEFDILCHLAKLNPDFDIEWGAGTMKELGVNNNYFHSILKGGD